MADALNRRLHRETVAADAPTVTGMRGHRIAVGDLILTRHNDSTIPLRDQDDPSVEPSPVRNGQRWEAVRVNRDNNRVAARRLEDNALAVFNGGYVQEHITHGYAVTAHSAQGVTADSAHAVLGESVERRLMYVAMTRGRHTNTAHVYQRAGEAHEYSRQVGAAPIAARGNGIEATELVRTILANDRLLVTAHDYSAQLPEAVLLSEVRTLSTARAAVVNRRTADFHVWRAERQEFERDTERARVRRRRERARTTDYGIEL